MSPFESRFNQFLATGEYIATEDARPKGWKPDPEKFLNNLLSQHDKVYHPNGFNPETERCTVREQLDKTNSIDDLSAAEKKEFEDRKTDKSGVKTRKNEKVLADVEKDGWRYVALKSDESYSDNHNEPDYKFCSLVSRASDGRYAMRPSRNNHVAEPDHISKFLEDPQKFVKDWNLFEFDDEYKHQVNGDRRLNPEFIANHEDYRKSSTPIGDPERGRQAIIDGPGAGYLATLEKEVAEGKTEGLEGEKERCRYYIENGKDDAEKQLHRDALAFLEELGKKAEKKNTPASKAYEPRFDMNKQGLHGYGKTDPSAKDAATLAATFNQRAEWGFSDDEVQAYFDAFKDMDAGKVPKLPDLDGKTYEPPMDTKWNGLQQALAAIFQKRPDLIRPYIVERLEDANFSSEVKELRSGDYKKRTKPYNSQKEYEERLRRQMAQDAAAAKYLKEC